MPTASVSTLRTVPRAAAPPATVDLFLAGVGAVGQALLRQLARRQPSSRLRLRLVGACTSRFALYAEQGLPPAGLPERLLHADGEDWRQRLLQRRSRTPIILVDATGSVEVARQYEQFMQAGLHLVTPSKHANTQEQAYFDRLLAVARERSIHYRYETTVGAGLPIVQAVQDFKAAGDRLHAVRGAASGTLTFLFSRLRRGQAFSEALRVAVAHGYAEPDPRDDLTGEDVARKFMILARTAGLRIERSVVAVEPLVPEALRGVSKEAFLDQIAGYDDRWRRRSDEAAREGQVLQYVGRLADDGRVTVGVERVPASSTLGQLDGIDNLFEVYTDRYASSPLSIRGPGAGPEVTAAGLLADILKAARAVAGRPA